MTSFITHKSHNLSDVSFNLFLNGMLVSSHKNEPCFHHITYSDRSLPPFDTIVVKKDYKYIPYTKKIVKWWIGEIKKFGFPCSCEFVHDEVFFKIRNCDHDNNKASINCTLMLLRCLFERYIYFVVARYIDLIKENKKKDRFLIMQEAHLTAGKINENFSYANSNHMLLSTWTPNYKAKTKKEFLDTIKQVNIKIGSGRTVHMDGLWL